MAMTIDRHHFSRSYRGNLWCRHDDMTLTVFKRKGGGYGWCIHAGDEPRYSRVTFESEEVALDDLLEEVGGAD